MSDEIAEGSLEMASAGMDDDAGLLVYDENVPILKQDGQRTGFGLYFRGAAIAEEGEGDGLSGFDDGVSATGQVVEHDACVGSPCIANDCLAYAHPPAQDEIDGLAVVLRFDGMRNRKIHAFMVAQIDYRGRFICDKLLNWAFVKFNLFKKSGKMKNQPLRFTKSNLPRLCIY